MPYLALEPVTSPSRLASAEARWQALAAIRPDLQPAIDLQRTLVTQVIQLADRLARERLPRLSLPGGYLATKLSHGVPALAGEPIPLPVDLLRGMLLTSCEALASGAAREAATHIHSSIASGDIEAGSLLAASLSRQQQAIRTGAVHRGLAPDLLWLVAELAVGPYAHLLQQTLLAASNGPLATALAAWDEGYCPSCGSWPAVAEVADNRRVLRCSLCAAAWEITKYACIYCGEDGEAFVTAAPDVERKDRRLELCAACGSYLKTVDVPGLSPFPLLTIADLETMDLDVAAMEHQYGRPPLKEFGGRKS